MSANEIYYPPIVVFREQDDVLWLSPCFPCNGTVRDIPYAYENGVDLILNISAYYKGRKERMLEFTLAQADVMRIAEMVQDATSGKTRSRSSEVKIALEHSFTFKTNGNKRMDYLEIRRTPSHPKKPREDVWTIEITNTVAPDESKVYKAGTSQFRLTDLQMMEMMRKAGKFFDVLESKVLEHIIDGWAGGLHYGY